MLSMVMLNSPAFFAQMHHMGDKKGHGREKIDQLEKIKLIEELNMSDEVSGKFFSKRREFREKGRRLNSKIDSLCQVVREKTSLEDSKIPDAEWGKLIDEFVLAERKIQNNKAEFMNSIQRILSPMQVAKFLAFERRFREEVQGILLRGRKMPMPE